MNVWKSWAESNGLNDAKFAKAMAPTMSRTGHRQTPQTKRQQYIHSKGPRIRQVQTGPGGKSKSSSRKRPRKTKALNVQDEEQLWKNRVLSEQNPNCSSLPIQHNRTVATRTPASQAGVHHFHDCQVAINY